MAVKNTPVVVVYGIEIPNPFGPILQTPDGKYIGQSEYAGALKEMGARFLRPKDADNPQSGCETIVRADGTPLVAGRMVKGGKFVVYYDTMLQPTDAYYVDSWGNHCKRALAMLKAERAAAASKVEA